MQVSWATHTHTVVSTEPPFTTGTSKSNNWPHHFFAMLAVDLVVIIVLVMCIDLRQNSNMNRNRM